MNTKHLEEQQARRDAYGETPLPDPDGDEDGEEMKPKRSRKGSAAITEQSDQVNT